MVNRYTGSASVTSTITTRSSEKDASSESEPMLAHAGNRPQSSTDLAQFSTSTQSHSSTGDTAATIAQRNAGFSAPPPFTGLSLDDLQSQHEVLNRIAFTPQWRDNTPAAIAHLRKLLPADPPPAYELLAWACDQFAAFTRSGSCGDSTALMDVLKALQTLIQDAESVQASNPPLDSASSPPPKRQRLTSTTRTTQVDTRPKPTSDDTASQLEDHLKALEDIPANAKDWLEQVDSIAKKIFAAVQHDERFDPGHHVRDACLMFDMLGSQIVGDDLINELRNALDDHRKTKPVAHVDSLDMRSSSMSTEPKEAAATTASGRLVFEDEVEAAVYDVMRLNPTLTTKALNEHPELSKFNIGVISPAARSVRACLAFGMPIEKFVQVLKRVAKSNDKKDFADNLPRKEKIGLSMDLFEDLKKTLRQYQCDHNGNLPANEVDATSLVRHLPRNTTTAAIWLAATCRDSSCISREEALNRWNTLVPTDEAAQLEDEQAALQPLADRTPNGRPLTVEEAIHQSPWLSHRKLKELLPELGSHGIKKGSQIQQASAYSLPDTRTILDVIRIANSASNADSCQKHLGRFGIAMNTIAFPDWKIALHIYKQTYGAPIPLSEIDLRNFVKCIQPSTTAAAVYIATAVSGHYCESLEDATTYWRGQEPGKFLPFEDRPLPQSFRHEPPAASQPGAQLR